MTRPYAEVIGDPISHSKSPLIHGFWLGKLGIDAEYRACHVRPEELADYLARRREDPAWRGCNVTIPHKEKVAAFLDAPDAKARFVGAVNTVLPLPAGALGGTNTDVDGVAAALAGRSLAGRRVVVLGAGGAARAALAFLADRRCARVKVMARDRDKARQVVTGCGIAAEIHPFAAHADALGDAALLINATQLGMTGQAEMPGFLLDALDAMARDAMVFDMVYAPLETKLLAAARSRGLRTCDGLAMLIGQAAVAFARFFDARAPRECDGELRELLTR